MVQLLRGCYDHQSPDTILHLLSKQLAGLQTPPNLSWTTLMFGGSEVLGWTCNGLRFQKHRILPMIITNPRKILRILVHGLLLGIDYVISL